jgi:prophage regulatory protein
MTSTIPNVDSAPNGGLKDARNPRQSIVAMQVAEALVKLSTVVEVTGLSRATIYRKVAESHFPQPVKLGARCTRWRAGDVSTWLKSQGAAA